MCLKRVILALEGKINNPTCSLKFGGKLILFWTYRYKKLDDVVAYEKNASQIVQTLNSLVFMGEHDHFMPGYSG